MPLLTPDLLDEDVAEALAELLGADARHERLAREHALLRVLDVVLRPALDEPLDAAGPHLALHHLQRALQVAVPHLHHDPPRRLQLRLPPPRRSRRRPQPPRRSRQCLH
uniref:Uncharacterized protein n=1 Tax=Triticum urartu TaxID=4572 RepID=A0A8R7U2L5_TRIUA